MSKSSLASCKDGESDRSYQKVKSHAGRAPSTAQKKAAKDHEESGENNRHRSDGNVNVSADRGQSSHEGGEDHPSQFFNGHKDLRFIVNQTEKLG
jgi:hypothetical protein